MVVRQHRYGVTNASDNSVLCLPRDWKGDGTKQAILFQCGLADTVLNTIYDPAKGQPLIDALVNAGYPVLMSDLGAGSGAGNPAAGSPQWGNSSAVARFAANRTYMQSTVGAKAGPVVVGGFSMGGLGSLNFAAANPTLVSALFGICPVTDLNVFRSQGTGGGNGGIDTAYGAVFHNTSVVVTSGSGTISDPAAASGDVGKLINSGSFNTGIPLDSRVGSVVAGTSYTLASGAVANANGTNLNVGGYSDTDYGATYNPRVNASTKYTGLPIKFYTSSTDTTAPTSAAVTVAGLIGANAQQVDMGTQGHSWSVTAAAAPLIVAWLKTLGI